MCTARFGLSKQNYESRTTCKQQMEEIRQHTRAHTHKPTQVMFLIIMRDIIWSERFDKQLHLNRSTQQTHCQSYIQFYLCFHSIACNEVVRCIFQNIYIYFKVSWNVWMHSSHTSVGQVSNKNSSCCSSSHRDKSHFMCCVVVLKTEKNTQKTTNR